MAKSFRIFNLIVNDPEMGDEFTGESFTKKRMADNRARELRKTFKNVEARPGKLRIGRDEPPDLEKDLLRKDVE